MHLSFQRVWMEHIGFGFSLYLARFCSCFRSQHPDVDVFASFAFLLDLWPTLSPTLNFCFALRYVSSLQQLLLYFLLYFVALCGSVRHLRTTFTFVCTQYRRLHLDFPSTILTAAHRGVCYGVSPLPFHISSCHLGYPVCLSVGIDCVVLLSPCFCFACPCHSNVLGSH